MKNALLRMHAAVLLWGFTGVLGVAISMDAPVLVWYRMLLTAGLIAVIITFRRQWLTVESKDMGRLALVGGLIAIHWVAFYGAMKFSNASIALVCLSTASIFTSIIDPFVNKTKWNAAELLLGLMALAGVYLIYRFQAFYGKGILFGVIAAVLSSVFTVLNKRLAGRYPARLTVFYEMSWGWFIVTIILLLMQVAGLNRFLLNPDNASGMLQLIPQGWDWLWLLLLALCCTVWAQSLALQALEKLDSFTVTLSVNLEPVYGIILAFIFFREDKDLHWGFYAGVGLIMLSVALQMLRLLRPKNASPGFIKEKSGLD